MAKSKYNKITIRQKKNSKGIMVGANTEVLLNGKRMKGLKSATFTVDAAGLAKVNLTMLGTVEVEGKIYAHQIGDYLPVQLKSQSKQQGKQK